ncbi:MAG TPA: hypothetical protein VIE65_03505 [Methylobacter sp.]
MTHEWQQLGNSLVVAIIRLLHIQKFQDKPSAYGQLGQSSPTAPGASQIRSWTSFHKA